MNTEYKIKLFTIGYTKKSAQQFFELLKKNQIKRVVDIRLNNKGVFAGFSKMGDIQYFCKILINADYIYKPEFAPTKDMLKRYRKKEITWEDYEKEYDDLIEKRNIKESLKINEYDYNCFLCSEHLPDKCHRKLLAEYFLKLNSNIEISHIK